MLSLNHFSPDINKIIYAGTEVGDKGDHFLVFSQALDTAQGAISSSNVFLNFLIGQKLLRCRMVQSPDGMCGEQPHINDK